MKRRLINIFIAFLCLLVLGCKKNSPPDKTPTPPFIEIPDITGASGMMTGTLPDGVYKFVTQGADSVSQKVFGIVDSAKAQGALVEQNNFATNRGQEWRITRLGNGEYSIINVNSGKALEVPQGTSDEDEQVWQSTVSAGSAQTWIIEPQGNNPVYRIKTKVDVRMGLHVADANKGTAIRLNAYSDQPVANGYFRVYRVAYKDNTASNFFKRNYTSGWNCGDGSHSVKLADGRVMWMMGDSNFDNWTSAGGGSVACLFQVNNCVMVQANNNWDPAAVQSYKGIGPGLPSFFKYLPDMRGRYMWVSEGIQIGTNTYVYCNVRKDGTNYGPPQLAKMTIAPGSSPSYAEVTYTNLSDDLAAATNGGLNFGQSFVKDGNWIYVYGSKSAGFNVNLYVARFANSDEGINGPWAYYKGGDYTADASWTTDIKQIVSVGTRSRPGSCTKIGTKYVYFSSVLALSSLCNPNYRQIFVGTSNTPVGPFTSEKMIYEVDDTLNGNSPIWYGVLVHPEYTANGEVLVTYNLNNYMCQASCSGRANPDNYRPRAVRIPIKLIDPAL